MPDTAAMEPTRDPRATLPDLIDVLLNKGVHLDLDLIISVADVPLIGVNLRATIAGIETMLEYGMMRQWDEQTRAWVQRSLRTHLPLADGEELVASMAGGHYQEDFYRTWRPGRAYLTTRRLIIHRRDPAETLWQAPLREIASITPVHQRSVGGGTRTRLRVVLYDGSETTLSAVDPEHLLALVRDQDAVTTALAPSGSEADVSDVRRQGRMWYLESLSGGGVWRAGRAVLSRQDGLTWRSPMDGRALVRIPPAEITECRLERHDNPTDHYGTLLVGTADLTVRLAADDIAQWHHELTEPNAEPDPDRSEEEVSTHGADR